MNAINTYNISQTLRSIYHELDRHGEYLSSIEETLRVANDF